jgi:hypothetical protein
LFADGGGASAGAEGVGGNGGRHGRGSGNHAGAVARQVGAVFSAGCDAGVEAESADVETGCDEKDFRFFKKSVIYGFIEASGITLHCLRFLVVTRSRAITQSKLRGL